VWTNMYDVTVKI